MPRLWRTPPTRRGCTAWWVGSSRYRPRRKPRSMISAPSSRRGRSVSVMRSRLRRDMGMRRLDPPNVPDPLALAASRGYEVRFRPNFPLLGLACWSILNHIPGIIFDEQLRDDPKRLKPIGYHEIHHLDAEVPPNGRVLTGSRTTIARIGSS